MAPFFDAGTAIGEWTVVRYIDCGRSGAVYEVRRKGLPNCRAALKINHGVNVVATPGQFARERETVRKNLIPGFSPAHLASGEYLGRQFYVMQLAERLPKRLTRTELKRIVARIARALAALHRAGYLHCDVKPDNIGLIDGRAVLLDMGSARTLAEASDDAIRVGTWEFMAPEVREALLLDARADIYSLAASLSRLCDSAALRTFGDAIRKGMSNDPNSRPQTAADLLRELESGKDRLAKFKIAAAVIGIVAVGFISAVYGGYWINRNHQLSTWGNSRDAKSVLKSFENRTNFPVPSERILR